MKRIILIMAFVGLHLSGVDSFQAGLIIGLASLVRPVYLTVAVVYLIIGVMLVLSLSTIPIIIMFGEKVAWIQDKVHDVGDFLTEGVYKVDDFVNDWARLGEEYTYTS